VERKKKESDLVEVEIKCFSITVFPNFKEIKNACYKKVVILVVILTAILNIKWLLLCKICDFTVII